MWTFLYKFYCTNTAFHRQGQAEACSWYLGIIDHSYTGRVTLVQFKKIFTVIEKYWMGILSVLKPFKSMQGSQCQGKPRKVREFEFPFFPAGKGKDFKSCPQIREKSGIFIILIINICTIFHPSFIKISPRGCK